MEPEATEVVVEKKSSSENGGAGGEDRRGADLLGFGESDRGSIIECFNFPQQEFIFDNNVIRLIEERNPRRRRIIFPA